MARVTPQEQTKTLTREEAVAELRRLRAEIAAANPDLTDEDWDDPAERLADEVNADLAERVRRSRGEVG